MGVVRFATLRLVGLAILLGCGSESTFVSADQSRPLQRWAVGAFKLFRDQGRERLA
jgi:hypothetical protein